MSYTLYPTPYTLHPMPYALYPIPYSLHPTPYTRHPTPYALHPTPYTLYPMSCTLHPTPYALCPIPYTLCPMPCIPYPIPYSPCPYSICQTPYPIPHAHTPYPRPHIRNSVPSLISAALVPVQHLTCAGFVAVMGRRGGRCLGLPRFRVLALSCTFSCVAYCSKEGFGPSCVAENRLPISATKKTFRKRAQLPSTETSSFRYNDQNVLQSVIEIWVVL